MTRTEARLKKYQTGEKLRYQQRRELRLERKRSEISGFILVFGGVVDTLIPFGVASGICRWIVGRRIARRPQGDVVA